MYSLLMLHKIAKEKRKKECKNNILKSDCFPGVKKLDMEPQLKLTCLCTCVPVRSNFFVGS